MAAANVDRRAAPGVELSNIPQINVQSESPGLSRSNSFQTPPGYKTSNFETSSMPRIGGLNGIESAQQHQAKKPKFVTRDGDIGGNYNETNVE